MHTHRHTWMAIGPAASPVHKSITCARTSHTSKAMTPFSVSALSSHPCTHACAPCLFSRQLAGFPPLCACVCAKNSLCVRAHAILLAFLTHTHAHARTRTHTHARACARAHTQRLLDVKVHVIYVERLNVVEQTRDPHVLLPRAYACCTVWVFISFVV